MTRQRVQPTLTQAPRQGSRVRPLRWAEAAEAAPADGGAEGAATRTSHWSQARSPKGHQHAHSSSSLAFLADAVTG